TLRHIGGSAPNPQNRLAKPPPVEIGGGFFLAPVSAPAPHRCRKSRRFPRDQLRQIHPIRSATRHHTQPDSARNSEHRSDGEIRWKPKTAFAVVMCAPAKHPSRSNRNWISRSCFAP